MPVTSSSFVFDGPAQKNGHRLVIETHVLSSGPNIVNNYFAPAGFDPNTLLAQHAAAINSGLTDQEQLNNMASEAAPVLQEQTMSNFLQAMRAAYKASDKGDTCRLARWLLRRIAAGQITDAQCQAAFGRTAQQWTNFKTNTLQPQSDAWDAVLSAAGA